MLIALQEYRITRIANKEYLRLKQEIVGKRMRGRYLKRWVGALVESRVEKAKENNARELLRPRKLKYYFDTFVLGVEMQREKLFVREQAGKVRDKKLKTNSFLIL